MIRSQDWQLALAAELEAAETMAFQWGSHDCCLFACDVIRAMTGVDLGADFRGKYDDAAGAAEVIAEATGGKGLDVLIAQICAANDMPEIAPAFAWRGDVCLFDTDLGPAVGIIAGSEAAYLSPDGLVMVPVEKLRTAWRV
jgi:hypothetical protein